MSLIDDFKSGKRYGTDWRAPTFQHMNSLVETVITSETASQSAVNESKSAAETANKAEKKIDEFIKTEGDSVVTINGVPQPTWSADFVEEEKAKSLEDDGAIVHERTLNSLSMCPSSNRISGIYDLSIGGYHEYYAPANGYVMVSVSMSDIPADHWIINRTAELEITMSRSKNAYAFMPCKKGDRITYYFTDGATPNLDFCKTRFIYAQEV